MTLNYQYVLVLGHEIYNILQKDFCKKKIKILMFLC